MWVTIYTDASYRKKRGGPRWAAWIRSDRGRIVRTGPCPRYVKDSTDAELCAIYAGLYLAFQAWGDAPKTLLVRSDCLVALEYVDGTVTPKPKRSGTRRLVELIRGLLEHRDVEVQTRWVRGHQGLKAGTPAYLNEQCDRLARTEGATRTRSRSQV